MDQLPSVSFFRTHVRPFVATNFDHTVGILVHRFDLQKRLINHPNELG